ncbi:FAD-binding oxidoreductase [Sphingobacteriales bacterium UPWRP_1]|nr:FAD-binding oxidoreductase [Sphingobacteriales bacterium UPWRP_1]
MPRNALNTQRPLLQLQKQLEGELYFDHTMRALYATDASVYRELPLAVALPKNTQDLQHLIAFALRHKTSLIPRAAGTSLAGQCVGSGIVVDVSKYFTQILEFNPSEKWVRVQPGVIRNDLNHFLQPHGLFFGPNTSTASRAMIGGMVGNNSCGSYSIVYGTTRQHVLEIKALLSDGSEVTFGPMDRLRFRQKAIGTSLESQLYRQIATDLGRPDVQREIREQFPYPEIHRRNTGYAVDELLKANPFTASGPDFNFCQLLCGSEGTLAIATEIKLNLVPLPPKEQVLLCAHFTSINEALHATLLAMQHQPRAVELMDKIVLDCTKDNLEQQKNRFFVEADPAAILIIEFAAHTKQESAQQAQQLIDAMKAQGYGYAFPMVFAPHINKVWKLREAGLGVLGNMKGDAKPVAVIEDTAVRLPDLPEYIARFTQIMGNFGQQSVYYAHAGAGELHLRPILNLKDEHHRRLFRQIGLESAKLVKEFGGSLSGEHGDGRVRAEFIPLMVGEKNYQLFKRLKQTWDPYHIFNPGKITDAPPMDTHLRYASGQETPDFDTVFNFSDTGGYLRAAEQCNGSGDCRKSHLSGGTMCPSYMATRNEKDTTRARANILREVLTASHLQRSAAPFNSKEIYEVMDLCLSCKGCKSECPSNVDVTLLKAEFLHQYYQSNGVPLRAKAFANIGRLNRLASVAPRFSNFFMGNRLSGNLLKKVLNIAPQRQLPALHPFTLRSWYKKWKPQNAGNKGTVYFFCDEFTNYNDVEAGIQTIQLLNALGYRVLMPPHAHSGRAHLSKGLLPQAQQLARQNIATFKPLITPQTPLVGVEPSALLSFRDEYPRLAGRELQADADNIAANTFLIDEFIYTEAQKGNILPEMFTTQPRHILLHAHCHQKALASAEATAFMLSLPQNYTVQVIPSGCCGMAGSFGYEAEHYEVSMNIGNLVLFPAIKNTPSETVIAAPGTSCRHQIADGTGRTALHPAQILFNALL